MIRLTAPQSLTASAIIRAGVLIGLALTLGGCISIPARAWRNGEAMSSSRAYQRVMSGDMSFSTRRELQNAVNFGALGFYQEAPAFSPFPKSGGWW
jgi:hypothetical protein